MTDLDTPVDTELSRTRFWLCSNAVSIALAYADLTRDAEDAYLLCIKSEAAVDLARWARGMVSRQGADINAKMGNDNRDNLGVDVLLIDEIRTLAHRAFSRAMGNLHPRLTDSTDRLYIDTWDLIAELFVYVGMRAAHTEVMADRPIPGTRAARAIEDLADRLLLDADYRGEADLKA